jgi:hypothetical protein
MNKKTLSAIVGIFGALSCTQSVHAAPVTFEVSIQETNDDGSLVGAEFSKIWDFSDAALWQTSSENPEVSDLIRTDIKWKNSSKLAFGAAAGIYVNDLKFDPDPMLSFDVTLVNNSARNQTYSIAYNTPLSPLLTGLVNSSSSLTAVLTDLNGNGNAKVSPLNGSSILRAFDLTVNDTEISKNVDVGNTFSIISGTGTQNWSAVNTLICGTGEFACENMSAVITVTLTKGDKVRLYGQVEQIQAVPVPSSALLLGSILALFAGVRRKFRAA